MYGLKRMRSDNVEVCGLLGALAERLRSSPLAVDEQHLSSALYGLQNCSSDKAEVRELLAAITHKVLSSPREFKPRAVSNSFFGLRGMWSGAAEVRDVVAALTLKANESKLVMRARFVCDALLGLQSMSDEAPEVRAALAALARKMQFSIDEMEGNALGNAVYGLQNCTGQPAETRQLLAALLDRAETSSLVAMGKDDLGRMLYGMQRLSQEVVEVQRLLALVAKRVVANPTLRGPWELGVALYGLRQYHLPAEWKPIIAAWLDALVTLDGAAAEASPINLRCCLQNALVVSFDKQAPLLRSIVAFQLEDALQLAIDRLRVLTQGITMRGFEPTADEGKFGQLAEDFLRRQPGEWTVERSALKDGFEADLIASSPHSTRAVNIEIDGVHHAREYKKRRFCDLRDRYFAEVLDMAVVRIDLIEMEASGLTPEAFVEKTLLPHFSSTQ